MTPPLRDRLPFPYRAEFDAVAEALAALDDRLDWGAVQAAALPWVQAARSRPAPFWALESLLREYPISSAEGLALMRLAEALLRVPDVETAVALTADQLGRADFATADGDDAAHAAQHPLLASLSATALALGQRLLADGDDAGLLQRLGSRAVVAAAVRAVQLLGRQFVFGRDIDAALAEAAASRRTQPAQRYSIDMLGEGARTDADAERHTAAYAAAIAAIADRGGPGATPAERDGISIKLSALDPRYDALQRDRVFAVLLPRVRALVDAAASAGLHLTIDAEESDRLELSLDLFDALADHAASAHRGWTGFGLAVQAYQTRALAVVDAVLATARRSGLQLMVRLVKGAYWDAEVKRAQEAGHPGYPVYTHKAHTDIAYLACAERLLAAPYAVYAQFATHNAGTIAALLQLARRDGRQRHGGAGFEFQRLHGMGEAVYREVLAATDAPRCRIYAPVGAHRDLLAYLVRRLLENGANSSFVHRLSDPAVPARDVLASPLDAATATPALPLPVDLYGAARRNAAGVDLRCAAMRAPLDAAVGALAATPAAAVAPATPADAAAAIATLAGGFAAWRDRPLADRVAVLRRAADALQARLPEFCALLVDEARRTLGDAVAEVREAIDFCRYYAAEAEATLADRVLPGPTGESNVLRLRGRGVVVCISPWNFPLAIFCGQVVAALVAGNAVAAKPAEQTPRIGERCTALLHAAGVPADALVCVPGDGDTVGAALVADARTAGVVFTGSTAVARAIARSLAARDGPIVPLVAETGGINAMVVDSTALPEQVVDAVLDSAFRSAGQRCSALRLLCLHDAVADAVVAMLGGAMATLVVGDPRDVATDVGPVIDADAHAALVREVQRLRAVARLIAETPVATPLPHVVAPVAFEIDRVADLRAEVFGPVLHVVRWRGAVDKLVDEINALGFGLTLGVQTRIDRRAERIAARARVGNVYVNRNMIGAVVGVQPFGGQGLSGTGPKAGGPHYLPRLATEQTLTVNTAAAGGNVELLTRR